MPARDRFQTAPACRRLSALAPALLLLPGLACRSIGPGTVPGDRFDYSSAIAESWKRQTLLNIVKLRYMDPPIFVDVGQIVAGYTLEGTLSAGGSLTGGDLTSRAVSLGAQGRYTDRPTITYTPLTGNKFLKALMTPVQPQSVFNMIQSGWPADRVLIMMTSAINGLRNQSASIRGVTPPEPRFLRAIELMRDIQSSGAVALRTTHDAARQETNVISIRSPEASPDTVAKVVELRELLHLSQEASEFKLVLAATASSDTEIALQTRSLFHLLMNLAAHVEVPEEDIAEKRATPGLESAADEPGASRPLRILSSDDKPDDAFVSVLYRDIWFWIDDRDLPSKRTLALMMMVFTLVEDSDDENLPVLTIPTG